MTAAIRKATKRASKEIEELLPAGTSISASGAIEGLPYLRPREIAILKFIYEFLARNRHYPTRGEISATVLQAKASGPSTPYIARLMKAGYLTKSKATAHRNLRLTALGIKRLSQEGIAVNNQQLLLPTAQ